MTHAQPLAPRPDQAAAVTALTAHLSPGGRGQLIAACGSGKTLIGRWTAEALDTRRTLVVVPSLELIGQTLTEWRRAGGEMFEAFICCSDPTTPMGRAEQAACTAWGVDAPVWAARRARVSTNPSVAARVLRESPAGRHVVVFSTYHSLAAVADAARTTRTSFDLAVFDEAHHLAGARAQWRRCLDDAYLPCVRRLFMTATPIDVADEDTASDGGMSDTALFGPVLSRLTFSDAIARGILVDYDVMVVDGGVTGPGAVVDPMAAFVAATAAGARRVVSFHGRVRKAARFANAAATVALPSGCRVEASTVHGKTIASERARILEGLRDVPAGTVRLVTNARCLTEGVDTPGLDAVIFADPKESVVDIIQGVGRALRRSPGKTRGLIVIPVLLERNGDDNTTLSTGPFAGVWKVIRALRAMDDRLTDGTGLTVRVASRRGVRTGQRNLPPIMFELPSWVDIATLTARLVDDTGDGWDRFYCHLQSWVLDHGALNEMPAAYAADDGSAVGLWCARQRTMYRRGALTRDRRRALEALPGWAWDPRAARWQAHAAELLDLVGRGTLDLTDEGSDVVLTAQACGRGVRDTTVGSWCAQQRIAHRRGELTAEQEATLKSIPGWTFDAVTAHDAAMLDLLAEYVAWKADANPPRDYVEDDQPLGRWLDHLRREHVTGHLSRPLLDELSEVTPRTGAGVLRWEPARTRWRLSYTALVQFTRREGTCRIPDQHVEHLADFDVPLYTWCTRQRHQYRLGQLEQGYADALTAVPGWLWEIPLREGHRVSLVGIDHGTRAAYARGCKCDTCTNANRAAQRERDQRAAAGLPTTLLVDAGDARGHALILAGQGFAKKAIARACNVNIKTLDELCEGVTRRLQPETAAAILTVTADDVRAASAPGTRVPAGPTWAILDDLRSRGWPASWLARELGLGTSLQLSRSEVTARNAELVQDLAAVIGSHRPPPRRCRQPLPALTDLDIERAS